LTGDCVATDPPFELAVRAAQAQHVSAMMSSTLVCRVILDIILNLLAKFADTPTCG